MSDLVYLNGDFLPKEQATVSVLDRGFLFGDGVYEVIPVYGGHLFRLTQHLERLSRSLRSIRMEDPLPREQWRAVFNRLLAQAGPLATDRAIYLQVTRGVAAKRDHGFPDPVKPTVFAMAYAAPQPAREQIEQGAAVITLEDIRWKCCDIKAITLLANVLLRQQATDQGAAEALLVRDGFVHEGTSSNFFLVHQGQIVTPPHGPYLLAGVTRDLVVELARADALRIIERPVSSAMLAAAEELWITSSTRELLPITSLDGEPVGTGEPGPLWRRLSGLFSDYKQRIREAYPG